MPRPTDAPGRLAGKSALITGGGAGIGAALAALFCAEGAAVTLVDLDASALEDTRRHIISQIPLAQVATLAADVAQATTAPQAVGLAVQSHGHLDVLVNNAAMRINQAIETATDQQWRALLDVNLLGSVALCRAALPALRQSYTSGGQPSIVNVSSCYAVKGRKNMGLYDASKAAMLAFTRTLAHEEAGHGIRVNAVCPGSTLTDFHLKKARAMGKPIEQLKNERQTTSLLGRWATPLEIAWPVLWLASDEASFITATTLMVDGGLHAL